MAETPKYGLFKRLGSGFDRYIGGLLGEDLEGMSPEEKSAARRSAIGIIGRGMVDPSQGSEALGAVVQARAQQRERPMRERAMQDIEQTQAAIAARMGAGRVASTSGKTYSMGPNIGEQKQLDEVKPLSGYNLPALLASPAGAAALEMNPMLKSMAEDYIKPKAPTQYEFRDVDGVGLFAINPTNPKDMRLIQRVKNVVSPAQPQLKEVYLPDGRVQDQWVLPGATVGTPLGSPRTPGGTKTLSDTLVTKLSLAQSLRDSESEIAKLNPSVAASGWETNRSERMKSSELKQYEAAAKRWAQNLNYYKSGATSGPAEVETNWQQYFPVAGDGAAEIALKNRQRRQEMTNIERVLREAGVKDLSLNPYPMIKGDKDPTYLRLEPGDVYMDESGNYKRKK